MINNKVNNLTKLFFMVSLFVSLISFLPMKVLAFNIDEDSALYMQISETNLYVDENTSEIEKQDVLSDWHTKNLMN